jgi:tetratricopeptide (TPR) repeat protein
VGDHPDDVSVIRSAISFYLRMGQAAKAEPLLRKLLLRENTAASDVAWARRTLATLLGGQGNHKEAVSLLDQNLAGGTRASEDLRAKAMVLGRQPSHRLRREAIGIMETLIQRPDHASQDRYMLVQLYEYEDQWHKARVEMQNLLASDGRNSIYLAHFVQSLLSRGELEAARPVMARLEETAPQSLLTVTTKARFLSADGKGAEAATLLQSFLRTAVGPAAQAMQKLRELIAEGNAEEAVAVVESYVEGQEDGLARNLLLRARELLSLGNTEEVLELLRQSLRSQEVEQAVQMALFSSFAKLCEQINQPAAAETLYRENASLSPNPDRALGLAAFLSRQGRTEEAIEMCEQAWKSASLAKVGAVSVAILRTGNATEAQMQRVGRWLDEARLNDPQSVSLALWTADLRDLQGRHKEAIELYRQVISRDPGNIVALNNLAWFWAQEGGERAVQGLSLINQAISTAGSIPELLDTRATVHLALRTADKAIADLDEAIDRFPIGSRASAMSYFHLACAYQMKGLRREAQGALAKAKESGFRPDWLHPLERNTYAVLETGLAQR